MKKSSIIHVIAPAGVVNKTNVQNGIKYISQLGLTCITGKSLFKKNGSLAGVDKDRLADLQNALNDDNATAIWMARGGYGTTRILDQIKWNSFFKNPTWLIGFSDITALHIQLSNHNIPSIHGPMITQAANPEHAVGVNLVSSILNNELPEYLLYSDKNNRKGSCKAPITGGNLTLITSTLGTATEIISDNKILFIEEIGEAAYRIDRMLVQLKRAHKLKKLKGLIIGHMTNITDEKEFGKTAIEIILEHTKEYTFPICFQFPSGHEAPNMPLILGMKSELIITEKEVRLRYL
jgi:muramoyltetrapeptide carboxypeptidase